MKLDLHVTLTRPGFELAVEVSLQENAVGIFGPSGAGKTTLLHTISGLVRPRAGRIVLDGDVLYDSASRVCVPPHKRRVGVVFQDGRLFPHLNVEGNLRYSERLLPVGARRIHFDEVVNLLEIEPLLHRPVYHLSGGECQRVALGRALLTSPRLLLLDEPLSALDLRLKAQILPYLRKIHQALGVPLLIVSHNLDEILHLTDHLVVLNHGGIVNYGRYLDLVQDTQALRILRTAGLLNVFRLRPVAHYPDHGISLLTIADESEAGTITAPYSSDAAEDTEVDVTLRPEDIALALERIGNISIQNQLPGEVVRIVQTDERILCVVYVGIHLLADVTRQTLEDLQLAPGKRVWCLFKAQALQRLKLPGKSPSPQLTSQLLEP